MCSLYIRKKVCTIQWNSFQQPFRQNVEFNVNMKIINDILYVGIA